MMLGDIPGVHWDVSRQANDNVVIWMEWVGMLLFQFLIILHSISYGLFFVGTRLSNLAALFDRDWGSRLVHILVGLFHERSIGNLHGLCRRLDLAKNQIAR